MKSRFTTIDICAVVNDIQRYLGMRVNNVYDIDNKTYLIRLMKPDHKVVLLIESGLRIHSTEFEWPKNMFPSGFAMKMRKHISGRRFVKLSMLGIDRILDFQFGSDEAAYHLIVELYDRGNIILTDYEYTILSLLRTRTDSDDVRFAVRERYPVENARQPEPLITPETLQQILSQTKAGDVLKKVLNPHLVFGPALLDHCLSQVGFPVNAKIEKDVNVDEDIPKIMEALVNAETYLESARISQCKGYIIQKREKKPARSGQDDTTDNELLTYQEFHPFLFEQHKDSPYLEFDSFNKAVDEFFSKLESQKLDTKALQQEKAVLKKLDNVKKDHEKRLGDLQKAQEEDMEKARLIEVNLPLVDQAIKVVNSAIANQIDWVEINALVKEAQAQGDYVAMAIKQLKLETNHITMILKDHYENSSDSDDNKEKASKKKPNVFKVDIDLGLTAHANARNYYTKKRLAATKEHKTMEASKKALKSAERKTKETLKEVATTTSIRKARKVYWFEKFFWFISSENYLVIGGRDQQQNELIVKRHLKPGDLYVHADLHGASSIVIKNPTSDVVPPKTLNEAGCMAICYSSAWSNRIITSAWWVYHHQVSKTAPTGEYLTTGSFMIRGKKNFLPPSYLILGFGFLFRLDETCVEKHVNERRPKFVEDDDGASNASIGEHDMKVDEDEEDLDIEENDSDQSDAERNVSVEKTGEDHSDKGSEEDEGIDMEKDKEEHEQDNEQDEDDKGHEEDRDDDEEDKNDEEDNSECKRDGQDEVNEDEQGILGVSFPDTSIDLQYTIGGKFQLQRGTSQSSSQTTDDFINLGDGELLDLRTLGRNNQEEKRKQRLSAKQRRQMRKKGAAVTITGEITGDDAEPPEQSGERLNESKTEVDEGKLKKPVAQQAVAKRGKKGKLKKIKGKYGDQDEEDRELMMQILGSAGAPKDGKGRKKDKDSKGRKGSARTRQGEQKNVKDSNKQKSGKDVTDQGRNEDKAEISEKTSEIHNTKKGEKENLGTSLESFARDLEQGMSNNADVNEPGAKGHDPTTKVDDHETKSEEVNDQEIEKDNLTLLDSLTGCPFPDDVTLFAIPVCAPYSAVQNYKHKVKLTPGTGRRGKAARTALHSFIQSRETTPREKDLLKSVKDADLSRYIPGKVKISAPNLHKNKK